MNAGGVQVVILVNDMAGEGLTAEHGLSIWIEADGKCILFDTGQGPALASNAARCGVALEEMEILVLSHGHYDHTGGVAAVLRHTPGANVYCHEGVFRARYSIRGGLAKPVQMPPASMQAIESMHPDKVHRVSKSMMISEHVGLTGFIPRITDYEDSGGPFYFDREGNVKDPIEDDMALWIRSKKGLVVCVGCCHAGLINTLNHVRQESGISLIGTIIGGFHLLNAERPRLERTVKDMRLLHPELIAPCHCTGEGAVQRLTEAFGEQVMPSRSGDRFDF